MLTKKLLILVYISLITLSYSPSSYSNSCSFIGASTRDALNSARDLYTKLKALKESTDCNVSEQSLTSLSRVEKYFDKYNNRKELEYEIAGFKIELKKYVTAYSEGSDPDYWASLILETKKKIIQSESSYKLMSDYDRDTLLSNSLYSVKDNLSSVISDYKNYATCIDSAPLRVGSVISSVVKLSGSIASVAGASPVWGGVGNLVGDLISEISQAIRHYRWKDVEDLKRMEIFYDLTCMIEIQSNLWCEKDREIELISDLMRDDPRDPDQQDDLWQGLDIQSRVVPAIQNWIRILYYGKAPITSDDADSYIFLRKKVADAEAILISARAKYNDLLEKIRDGGNVLNLVRMNLDIITKKMVGSISGGGSSNGMGMEWSSGMEYFKEAFGQANVTYILITKDEDPWPVSPPTCPEDEDGCDLILEFLRKSYGLGNASDVDNPTLLQEIVKSIDTNLVKMETEINKILESDMRKGNSTTPEGSLHDGILANNVFKLSAKNGLAILKKYIESTIDTLRRYYEYGLVEDYATTERREEVERDVKEQCLKYKKVRNYVVEKILINEGCPISLQIAYKTKKIVDDLYFKLSDNTSEPQTRVDDIKALLQFKKNRTLLLSELVIHILKADLDALVGMDEINPASSDIVYLEKESILEILRHEGNTNRMLNAKRARIKAQGIIKRNLEVLIGTTPIRKMIISEMKHLPKETFEETCAILLSSEYDSSTKKLFGGRGGRKNKAKKEIEKICKGVRLVSEWNIINEEEGETVLPELNVIFDDFFDNEFKDRVCTYKNYIKRNDIFELKRSRRKDKH